MRICSKCDAHKPDSEFRYYHRTRCKECYRAADAARFRNDPRVKARHKAYAMSDRGKARHGAAVKADHARKPWKYRARNILNAAVRDGKVVKPSCCSRCGGVGRLHGHHHDYSKPLAVEWLCNPCHRAEHKDNHHDA